MPPALVLETSCLKINLRVILKSGRYNNKEKSTKLHHAESEKKLKIKKSKKIKKATRKLTILRMMIIVLEGGNGQKIHSL